VGEAFVAAGAREVVAATRPVSDRTTRQLFGAFYEARSAGLSVAASLRKAQLQLRAAQPTADWASFRLLIGR